MADQKALKKRLKVLMNRPENQVCSDCPERQPRWASLIVPPPGAPPGSLPIGAFCCLECSGSHRRLGVHISFVRSVNLDSWKEKEVLAMENGGNTKVNAIFEANLTVQKPSNHADGPTRERFIRDKYERRKFYDSSAFAKLAQAPPAGAAASGGGGGGGQQEIVLPALHNQQQQQQAGNMGAPSPAARRRLEARKSSGLESLSSTNARANPPRTNKSKSSNSSLSSLGSSTGAATPVADLLDFSEPAVTDNHNSNSKPPKSSRNKKSKEKDLMGFDSASSGNDFADFSSANADPTSAEFGDFTSSAAAAPPVNSTPVASNTKKTANNNQNAQDIMNLYNRGGGMNGMPNNNNNMMMMNNNMQQQQQQQTNMAMMQQAMQQMSMQQAMQQQQQQPQQQQGIPLANMNAQQMQQQAMMYQQHMMRLQQMRNSMPAGNMGGMQGGTMGNNNNMMMGRGNNTMGQNNPGGFGGMAQSMRGQVQPNSGGATSNVSSDGQAMTGLASMHSVDSTSSHQTNDGADPFASLSARHGF